MTGTSWLHLAASDLMKLEEVSSEAMQRTANSALWGLAF